MTHERAPAPLIYDLYPDPLMIGMIVLSAQGKILDANEKACRMLGYAATELGEINFIDLLTPDEGMKEDPFVQIQSGGRDSFHHNEQLQCKNGGFLHANITLQAIRADDGQVDHQVVYFDHSRDELQLKSIQAAQLASLGELSAGVAHEINNPITGVINYAQILRNRMDEDNELHNLARLIIKEGSRVAAIVKDMLFFVGNRSGKKVLTTPIELVEHTLTLIRWQLERDGIELKVDVPGTLPLLRVNFQELQQLLLNLINNSRYALNEKFPEPTADKWLKISCTVINVADSAALQLVVDDNGTGVQPQVLDRVLNPFVTTKPAGSGTGLGLSLCHDIVKRHGGQIRVESEYGKGAQVLLDLPLPKKTKPANQG